MFRTIYVMVISSVLFTFALAASAQTTAQATKPTTRSAVLFNMRQQIVDTAIKCDKDVQLIVEMRDMPKLKSDSDVLRFLEAKVRLKDDKILVGVARRYLEKQTNGPLDDEDSVVLDAIVCKMMSNIKAQDEFLDWSLRFRLDEINQDLRSLGETIDETRKLHDNLSRKN